MKRCFVFFILVSIIGILSANHAPYVEDIVFSQRTDGSHMVDIYFNLIDQDFDVLSVSISASNDLGETWDYPMETYTGDFGESLLAGNGKHIVWDFSTDHQNSFEPNVRFRITVSDGYYEPDNDFHWATINAGQFTYGSSNTVLSIDYDYEIMIYPVTNQQYVNFLEEKLSAGEIQIVDYNIVGFYEGDEYYSAGNYNLLIMELNSFIAWNGTHFIIIDGYEQHPVVNVTWFGADNFAQYYGWRLPTEQEWEKAARGMTGYTYPWGNQMDSHRANYNGSGDPWENTQFAETSPGGFFNGQEFAGFQTIDSPSPYGCYDMCGNVWNWTDSWYSNYGDRTLRGGSFHYTHTNARLKSYNRHYDESDETGSWNDYGFRCATTLE